jgi:hypothetical protein
MSPFTEDVPVHDTALMDDAPAPICIAHIARDEDREARYAKAVEVAKAVYGTDRRGRAAATNSMVHDVLNEMERIAGC